MFVKIHYNNLKIQLLIKSEKVLLQLSYMILNIKLANGITNKIIHLPVASICAFRAKWCLSLTSLICPKI